MNDWEKRQVSEGVSITTGRRLRQAVRRELAQAQGWMYEPQDGMRKGHAKALQGGS